MDAIQAVLVVLAIQLALAAAGWWLSAVLLGLSRGPALYWGAFCLLALFSAGLGLSAANPHDALPLAGANLALIAAFIAVGRGVAQFLGRRLPAWPDALALGFVVLLGVIDVSDGLDPLLRSALISFTLAAVALRDGLMSARGVRAEFGSVVAGLVSGPMLLTAGLFGWRLARLYLQPPSEDTVLMTAPTHGNLIAVFGLTTLAALFNLSLAHMVVTRLVRRLHHLSRHDTLTGLMNRRALLNALEGEQNRMRRGGAGWALLLLDVDHFKRVNDLFGHTMGDTVLCRVAEVLRESARDMDTVARMGGEEFCVLAPMTDLHGAALLAERLRQAVAASSSRPDDVAVTISVGVALARLGSSELAESALSRADVALYRAKAGGRDRVEMSPDDEIAAAPESREPLAV